MKKSIFFNLLLLLLAGNLISQNDNIHIGDGPLESSAVFQIDKTNKGVLIPRLTTAQRNAIASPADGLLVYDTDSKSFWHFNGLVWCDVSAPDHITDKDGDTRIMVEESFDLDKIQVYLKGDRVFEITENEEGNPVVSFPNASYSSTFFGYHAGLQDSTFFNNVGIGRSALQENKMGIFNTAVGSFTLEKNKSNSNTAIGSNSMRENTTGSNNTALGYASLFSNTTGVDNVAIGSSSNHQSNASYNTSVGSGTLFRNISGDKNSIVGCYALFNNTTGASNVSLGFGSLQQNTTASHNVAVGTQAMQVNTTGFSNTVVGDSASYNSNSSYNVSIGKNTMFNTTTGFSNSALGYAALVTNTNGSHNTALGESALGGNTSGNYNIGLGDDSALGVQSGSHNIGIGTGTLAHSDDQSFLVALGDSSLYNNGTDANGTEATKNTAIGAKVLRSNTVGQANTSLGYESSYKNVNGDFNTAIGHQSLYSNIDGDWNTAVGNTSMYNNISGIYNTAIGQQALHGNTVGIQNTAVGYDAHYSSNIGNKNTAVGAGALYSNDVGHENTMVGHEAGFGNVQGSGNVFLGFKAGYNEFGSNKLYIDNSDTATPLIYGDFSADSLSLNARVGVNTMPATSSDLHIKQLQNNTGVRLEYSTDTDFWNTYIDILDDYNFSYNGTIKSYIQDTDGSYMSLSDRRLKSNIQDVSNVLNRLVHLPAKSYTYKSDKTAKSTIGFIAQEVEQFFPELVGEKDGFKSVNYSGFAVLAVKAIQEQQEIIEKQASIIEDVLKRLEQLEAKK